MARPAGTGKTSTRPIPTPRPRGQAQLCAAETAFKKPEEFVKASAIFGDGVAPHTVGYFPEAPNRQSLGYWHTEIFGIVSDAAPVSRECGAVSNGDRASRLLFRNPEE